MPVLSKNQGIIANYVNFISNFPFFCAPTPPAEGHLFQKTATKQPFFPFTATLGLSFVFLTKSTPPAQKFFHAGGVLYIFTFLC